MSETPRIAVDPEHHRPQLEPPFLGIAAPPLEGERICVCGEPEGDHLADGTCPILGARDWLDGGGHLFEPDPGEETTRPDIQVEYEPGCEPTTGVR